MPVNDRRKAQLKLIIDDPASTEQERSEATRALSELTTDPPQSPRRRGRNASVPPTQDDQDCDLLAALSFRRNDGLTTSDYSDLCQAFDQLTNDCIDTIGNTQLLWIWKLNDTQLMIDLYGRTNSAEIKSKCRAVIEHIAAHSPIDTAKLQATEFLPNLNQEK